MLSFLRSIHTRGPFLHSKWPSPRAGEGEEGHGYSARWRRRRARKVQSSGTAVNLRASHRGGPLNPPLMDELLLVVLRRALLHPLDRRDRPDVLRGLYTLITVRAAVITSVYLDGLNAEFSCREFRLLRPDTLWWMFSFTWQFIPDIRAELLSKHTARCIFKVNI